MRILIAEDEAVSRRLLQQTLQRWGYEVVVASDGTEAWQCLQSADAPQLAIVDWMMPGIDGIELCQRARSLDTEVPTYLILLTSRSSREDVVAGLQAGADDYVVKPFDEAELRARLQVGVRVVQLQVSLADRVHDLEDALSRVKQLQGLLPICSYCKKIRDDRNYWQQVEQYVTERSEARFTHGICPSCYERHVKPELEGLHEEPR
jgi:DNA-binding response OmpR family regulator